MGIALLIIIIVIAVFLISRIKIVPQAEVFVIERLGTFKCEWQTGLHLLVPFFDRIAKKISIKEQVEDFEPQPVITKDNVTIQIDDIIFYQITNATKYTYGVDNPIKAIENLTATTLRNIIGEMELDATLTSRDVINSKITAALDAATDNWGIKINRVELRNIIPPREIQDSMEKQMKAERERRERVTRAEGEKKSKILLAEGEKESKILQAEGEKESAILRAQALKQQKILVAEGEAQSIEMIQKSIADSIVKLNDSNPSDAVIKLKSLEAFGKAADGKATKIIIPSEIQGIAGLAEGIKESVTDIHKDKKEE